jgi:hypothetical protein
MILARNEGADYFNKLIHKFYVLRAKCGPLQTALNMEELFLHLQIQLISLNTNSKRIINYF